MTLGAQFYVWVGELPPLLFIFAFGCCAGSFINVLVWRLPRGLGVVRPPSRCPRCENRLSWSENIPVLGWILLRGRCRTCRAPISPEYPIVEFTVGVMFVTLYALAFGREIPFGMLGVDTASIRPDWAVGGVARMWPTLTLQFLLVGALVAMTLIDARTFTIPLSIPWVLCAAALVAHPLHALALSHLSDSGLRRSPFPWTIPTFGWAGTIAAVGAGAGLVISNALLAIGVMPRSFDDFDEWERSVEAKRANGEHPRHEEADTSIRAEVGPLLLRVFMLTGPGMAGMFLGFAAGMSWGAPIAGMAVGAALGLIAGVLLRSMVRTGPMSGEPSWLEYPHARREMVKELAFVAPCVALLAAGWWFGSTLSGEPPLWLRALGGSVAGAVVGGGAIWAVRILGTLAFGREAMGLGDVHLMAGVGAILGWIDPSIAFLVAPFSGIAWAVLSPLLGRILKRQGTVLPYGPHLAFATLALVYAKPFFEALLSGIVGEPVDLP